ncbi:MAG TPA: TrbI/VirB10 family protein [Terriglobales bacterium]
MTENVQSPVTPNRIEDRAPKPLGVIPKHLQSLVIMGVAVAMVLVMWLTGNSKKAALPRPISPPPPPVSPTDSAKVQDLRQTIQSEQQAARRAIAVPEAAPAGAYDVPGIPGAYMNPSQPLGPQAMAAGNASSAGAPPIPGYPPGEPSAGTSVSPQDSLKADKKKRQYLSLFASNVALTYRQGEEARKLEGTGSGANSADPPQTLASAQDPQADYLRQLQALEAAAQPLPPALGTAVTGQKTAETPERNKIAASAAELSGGPAKPVDPTAADAGSLNKASGKNYVLFEGTVIETVLMNRLDGSFSGPVNCLVTHDVYSHDRQRVLIPAGSKVLGSADKVNTFGQQRLAVAFHRLIMPDGYSVSLDQFKGLNQIGETALRDKVNNHYLKIFGASLAIGVLGGIAQAGTGDVFDQSALDRARTGFGQSTALAGMQILDRFLNILPTITIREGNRVKVYLSNDLLLPDYAQHHMASDL